MRCSTLGMAAACAAVATAQTPAGSSPSTSKNVGVAFSDITITPGKWISPDGKPPIPTTAQIQF